MESYITEIMALIDQRDSTVLDTQLYNYHPYEISETLFELNEDQRAFLYDSISAADIAIVFSYIELDDIMTFFDEMSPKYIIGIIQNLDLDDAVDIMQILTAEERSAYLKLMDEEHRQEIQRLFKYEEDSAGSIMTTEYIEVSVHAVVEEAMRHLISQAVDAATINTIYVTDQKNILVGTLSLRELILARKGELVKDIMNTRIISVMTTMDQEDVAAIFKDYDFTNLPVVDRLNRMVGIITVDDIMDVIEDEALEDYSMFAGVSDAEIDSQKETIWMSAKKRLPWLLILSVLGFITSTVIAQFEGTLALVPTIALFMPMILGMAGNTGTQSLAVTIRGLNNNEFSTGSSIRKHIFREVGTGLLNGVLIGIILFGVTLGFLLLTNDVNALRIAQVVSLSLLVSLTISTTAGALMPIIINSFNIDPAVASGPFVTMIIDIIALSVYFSLATILIINTL